MSIVLLSGTSSAAPTLYQLTVLPDLPYGEDFSRAYGLNDSGQVVGDSQTAGGQRAFIWDATNGMHDLGVLSDVANANFSTGSKINSSGVVVGDSGRTPDMVWDRRIFVWNQTNGMSDVGLASPVGARDINDNGVIAGNFANIPVIGSPSTGWQTIGPALSGDDYRYSFGINNQNQVVGVEVISNVEQAFYWDQVAGLTYLPSILGGASNAWAWEINDVGQIIGWAQTNAGQTAVLWDPSIGLINLGDLAGGDENAIAHDLNNLGEIVGIATNDKGQRATYWTAQSGPIDLNDELINPLSNFTLTDARGINEHGQIVGFGTLDGSITRGFLLTPVPEVSSLMLGAVLFFAVAALRIALAIKIRLPGKCKVSVSVK